MEIKTTTGHLSMAIEAAAFRCLQDIEARANASKDKGLVDANLAIAAFDAARGAFIQMPTDDVTRDFLGAGAVTVYDDLSHPYSDTVKLPYSWRRWYNDARVVLAPFMELGAAVPVVDGMHANEQIKEAYIRAMMALGRSQERRQR